MKPLSERDENPLKRPLQQIQHFGVGMKPLSERDENNNKNSIRKSMSFARRNEATLWKRWELPSLSIQ